MRAAGEGETDLSKVTQLVNEPSDEPRLKSVWLQRPRSCPAPKGARGWIGKAKRHADDTRPSLPQAWLGCCLHFALCPRGGGGGRDSGSQ